jgi:HNH endonuclease
MIPSQEYLKSILHYDPETGVWTWIKPPKHNLRLLDREAGYARSPDGYRVIRIWGAPYYASRLACLYMTGKWPDEEMDHINRDPTDDRWDNLREATSSLNKYNQERHMERGVT